ncbi:hypothetical protein EIP91_001689 [Steccherinum ochraceum]|uniref:Elongin-A n=1 Tax=Steccherinum ochraceum TaxID=92696 RepID=A0A4R0RJW4_9APHY|nr:hypothetical protein EIP91_001689 [Steccherinum ochraceum]
MLCQRVVALHADRLESLEGVRIDLARPLLDKCSAETLLRLEEASPEITEATVDAWKSLCFSLYPLAAQSVCMEREPASWRESFFCIREQEARRFEDLKVRLRSQREEAEQRKKEGQVKYTDRLPPAKRRGWIPTPPKSLFQKTRSDAVKVSKGIYSLHRNPTMPATMGQKILPIPTNAKLLPSPPLRSLPTSSATSGSRVTVTAISVRRNSTATLKSSPKPSAAISQSHHPIVIHSQASSDAKRQKLTVVDCNDLPSPKPSLIERTTPLKPPLPRRDPKTSLFIPKHRVSSQLPTALGVRSRG